MRPAPPCHMSGAGQPPWSSPVSLLSSDVSRFWQGCLGCGLRVALLAGEVAGVSGCLRLRLGSCEGQLTLWVDRRLASLMLPACPGGGAQEGLFISFPASAGTTLGTFLLFGALSAPRGLTKAAGEGLAGWKS